MRYVLDSHPLIVYFKKQPGWQAVEALLLQAKEREESLLLSLINWGEIYYVRTASAGIEEAERTARSLEILPIRIIAPDREITRQAAQFKALGGISYADCFAAALAVNEHATLVTGDREFEKLEKKGLIKVKWI